jgi:hypothetical protein
VTAYLFRKIPAAEDSDSPQQRGRFFAILSREGALGFRRHDDAAPASALPGCPHRVIQAATAANRSGHKVKVADEPQ